MTVFAVVSPSRRLRAVVLAFACVHWCAAGACAFGWWAPLAWPWLAVASHALAGLALSITACRRALVRAIELIAPDTLRISVQPMDGQTREVWQVLPQTSVWPGLLLLCCRDAAGRRRQLLVCGDSVAPGVLPALVRALRAKKAGTYCAEPTL